MNKKLKECQDELKEIQKELNEYDDEFEKDITNLKTRIIFRL